MWVNGQAHHTNGGNKMLFLLCRADPKSAQVECCSALCRRMERSVGP